MTTKADLVTGRPKGSGEHDALTPTVFHEPWFLHAATGGDYQEVTVSASGRVVGRFPFTINSLPARQILCGMPDLTHFLGPAIDAGGGAATNRVLRHDGILRELLDKLPAQSGVFQKLHRGTTNTLVYQELGYRTAVQFSYDILPASEQSLWSSMRDKTRNVIRRAREQYTVVDIVEPELFLIRYQANLQALGKTNYYDRMMALCTEVLLRKRGRILAAQTPVGKIAAAIVYIWDHQAAYYFLSTRSQQAGNGAVSLLIWSAMKDAAERGLVFDFDGLSAPGSRVFYTGFGGAVVPRYVVSRYSFAHRVAGRLSNPFRLPTKQYFQW